jgi:photosystem II stability/assembly factor-like uncharacterized protein
VSRAARCALLLGLVPALSTAADSSPTEKWTMQFFHDVAGSNLAITDFACPSAKRCTAAGILADKNRTRGTAVVTSDGGKHWSYVDIAELPVALFFIDDSTGWVATNKGIWGTSESGRSWKKLDSLEGVECLYFLNADHGFAVGSPNLVEETRDGGKHWSRINTGGPSGRENQDATYSWVTFSGLHGLIVGSEHPFLRSMPGWTEVDRSRYERERPQSKIVLETLDGGKTWIRHTERQLGDPEQLLFLRTGDILVLSQFHDSYEVPSAVYRLDHATQDSVAIYREKGHAITDMAALPGGRLLLAGIDLPGQSNQVLIPSRLNILRSNGPDSWISMDVDYRAVARRATLGIGDADNMWVATDTGMILKLVQKP